MPVDIEENRVRDDYISFAASVSAVEAVASFTKKDLLRSTLSSKT